MALNRRAQVEEGAMEYRCARDIMSRKVICVPADTDLRDLARMFLEEKITGAPVIGRDGALVGVISQTDLLFSQLSRGDELVLATDFYQTVRVEGHHLPAGFQIEDANTQTVEEVMTPVVHSVLETTPLDTIARMMTRERIHRVIVRRGREVVGIITALDLLRILARPARRSGGGPTAAAHKSPPGKTKVAAKRSGSRKS
jgi:CBS domain-containing protein